MKKLKHIIVAILVGSCISFYSCGPNDDKGSMSDQYSGEEQQIDSSRMIAPDSLNNTGTRSDGEGF